METKIMKKILKVLVYVFAGITFIYNFWLFNTLVFDNTATAYPLRDITIRQFWIILRLLVSVYILTNFLKSDTKDKE